MKIDFPTLGASTAIQFGIFCIKNLLETGFLSSKFLMSATMYFITLKYLYLIVSNQDSQCANIDAEVLNSNFN